MRRQGGREEMVAGRGGDAQAVGREQMRRWWPDGSRRGDGGRTGADGREEMARRRQARQGRDGGPKGDAEMVQGGKWGREIGREGKWGRKMEEGNREGIKA
ncbi:hypothetical protein ACLOJK_016390 [Asimina triloba]